jgi:hypothetical protein
MEMDRLWERERTRFTFYSTIRAVPDDHASSSTLIHIHIVAKRNKLIPIYSLYSWTRTLAKKMAKLLSISSQIIFFHGTSSISQFQDK